MKKFAEFFAGVGLVREGLDPFGWECVWSNDISPDKMSTYTANFGDGDFWLGDIWDVAKNPDILPDEVFLYTASFPCTDLSVAGARAGLAGEESGTINALFEILNQKKTNGNLPKVILLENVRGFLTSHAGNDVIQTVKNFSELGYFVDIIELDAIKFSAQSRPRVFVIAVLGSIAKDVMQLKPTESIFSDWWDLFDSMPLLRSDKIKNIILSSENLNWGLFDIPTPKDAGIKLNTVIETDIDPQLWWDADRKAKIFAQMSDGHQEILNNWISSDQINYGTVYRRMRYGKSMAELRTDGVAGCLRTPRGGSSKQILICAGKGSWSVRLLTPREYARLQGVRDTFLLPDNANKGYFAMGDAVCVPVIKFIAENILEKIFVYLNDQNNLDKCA